MSVRVVARVFRSYEGAIRWLQMHPISALHGCMILRVIYMRTTRGGSFQLHLFEQAEPTAPRYDYRQDIVGD